MYDRVFAAMYLSVRKNWVSASIGRLNKPRDSGVLGSLPREPPPYPPRAQSDKSRRHGMFSLGADFDTAYLFTSIRECTADNNYGQPIVSLLTGVARVARSYLRAGFTGGLVVDYPNSTKAKKYYLCLSFEHGYKAPAAKVAEQQGGAAAAKFDVSSLF